MRWSWLPNIGHPIPSRADAVPSRARQQADNPWPQPPASLLSDPGCHRQLNEDSGRLAYSAERGLLAVVADGMGGHQAGEVASQTAVATIEHEYFDSRNSPGQALEKAFHEAHARIFKLAAGNANLSGMGTTCTALALMGAYAWAAHIGDSRLYLVRGDSIYQLSEDHTQCAEMVRQGLLTAEEARRREDRNVLSRAMGTRAEISLMLWKTPMSVRPGDFFVLCSDGLHELVDAEEIRVVVSAAQPDAACRKLVELARARGGYDNITVAVVAIPALRETRVSEVNK